MKLSTLAILFIAVHFLFATAQAACGGSPIDEYKSKALVKSRGVFDQLSRSTPIDNIMTACVCYRSDKQQGCLGFMCATCNNDNYSNEDFITRCEQAASAIRPDIGVGSSGWCEYPGLKGLRMVSYWKQIN
ncbi:MAG: hypothetical protein BYD32DRAFT_419527 [Podila humilis]|nr:MAG: hypothetical protein BYD32DRAFT_419527 [Podila humilis]